ncbi:MAG: N-acetylmuramoyl-L-alanine amidase [Ignavibacteria bacterium]|nr:N-acetylmuramoyl-L-alanine amidase [Ignavibacteria bacterium]
MNSAKPLFFGKKFFLDPGHGGEDRKSVGVNKRVVEADINLAVALELRKYLADAGADVILSRDKDTTIALSDRSELANKSGADFFISIHHNAPGRYGDEWIDYTSTYYHGKDTNYEYTPMCQDIARYVQRDLSYALRTSGGPGSFDGTYSDYNIYPGEGFSVLRKTKIPAILVECAFFTNAYQEEKLAIREYNRLEAFGIFRGLFRYLKSGYPVWKNPVIERTNDSVAVTLHAEDSLGIVETSVKVFVNKKEIHTFDFNKAQKNLHIILRPADENPMIIRVEARNKNGNYSYPIELKIDNILLK